MNIQYSKSSKKIAHEIIYKIYICPYCKRRLPNFTFLTKNKCIWCDLDNWYNKNIKRNT
jgi:hypothetical protein